ncbi:hypothetical protein CFO_g932 [Ceratocystis platani]|uniref:N-acetyltransferase domain-containing protein n=1 Tax=Ceratocystis fimbriata f. sp. platani TaxID=88771 RepID=A0A0F8B4E1_CERFI|nr:hypothetical protein CFO_g932 [Ceratocystis platani]
METIHIPGLTFEAGIRHLTIADAEACQIVENDAFTNPNYRATPEKACRNPFRYRLTHYPDLCLGLFLKAPANAVLDGKPLPSPSSDSTSESGGKWTLVCHIIASRSANPVISDGDMEVPAGWTPDPSSARTGSMAALHSFACVHAAQGKGLGRQLMANYVQRMTRAPDVELIALLCQDHLLGVYTSMGYTRSHTESLATFGGGGWNDMILETKS